MATAAKKAVETASVVMKLSPADIRVPKRLGVLHPDKGAAIGKLMLRDGQREPIKVKRNGPRAEQPWDLVVGEHRHYGATLEGLVLDALEVEGDEVTLRQIEASENIERGSRSPIERACFVRAIANAAEMRLKDQHEGLSQQQIAVRARWDAMQGKAFSVERDDALAETEAEHTAANFATVYGWQEATADALGLSKRTIRDDLALHRALVLPFPDLYRDLATHPIVGENASALREIASLKDVSVRRAVIEDLIAAPDMTLAEALAGQGQDKVSAPAKAGATKHMDNATSNIERLSLADQRSWAPTFVQAIKPQALREFAAVLARRIEELGL